MSFTFFNPNAPLEITQKHLPHWEQDGATYFITFRTADSIPRDVLEKWLAERAAWLSQHGIDHTNEDWQMHLESLPDTDRQAFHRTFTTQWHEHLDECHGACVLKQPELSQIVADALLHFDDGRYQMSDFVVMPNHVHLLVGMKNRTDMRRTCRSWKKFSATEINKKVGVRGEFWQPESFDHLVRGEASFQRYRRYIADNPAKSQLGTSDHVLWQASPLQSSPVTP